MVLGRITRTIRRTGGRAGRTIGRRPAAAGAAGFTGGILLDDVPLVGETLDPTEGGAGGGTNWTLLAVLGLALVALAGWIE